MSFQLSYFNENYTITTKTFDELKLISSSRKFRIIETPTNWLTNVLQNASAINTIIFCNVYIGNICIYLYLHNMCASRIRHNRTNPDIVIAPHYINIFFLFMFGRIIFHLCEFAFRLTLTRARHNTHTFTNVAQVRAAVWLSHGLFWKCDPYANRIVVSSAYNENHYLAKALGCYKVRIFIWSLIKFFLPVSEFYAFEAFNLFNMCKMSRIHISVQWSASWYSVFQCDTSVYYYNTKI